jgi:methionyl-tRNA formyltransferase
MAAQLNIVFMGTPEFAAVVLRHLAAHESTSIQAVYTQPDRPRGRGRKTVPPPVKVVAGEAGLQVRQPETLRDPEVEAGLRRIQPDLLVVAAYGLILPKAILDIPRLGALNVHASLLPKYRGAAPIQRALAAGEGVTGISIMRMEPGLDCGPVLLQRPLAIAPEDTAADLHDKLADLGGKALIQALDRLAAGDIVSVPQDEAQATYAPKLRKDEGRIDWNQPARRVHDHIRAMHPWPGAFTSLDLGPGGKGLKVHISPGHIREEPETALPPGSVVLGPEDTLLIACADRLYQVVSIKPESSRPMPASAFVCGYLSSRSEPGRARCR